MDYMDTNVLKKADSLSLSLSLSIYIIMKTHVRGFFDTDLHEVSWHFATHEAVRPSGF